MLHKMHPKQFGATLLELMMILAIIALLTLTFAVNAPERKVAERWDHMQTEIESLKLAITDCLSASMGSPSECDQPEKIQQHTGFVVKTLVDGAAIVIVSQTAAIAVTIDKKEGDCAILVSPTIEGNFVKWKQNSTGQNCNNVARSRGA